MAISTEERQKILEEFVKAWPVTRLEAMQLVDYISVGEKNTLAYWLEFGDGRYLGSMKGGDSSKFGIYERKAAPKGQRDFISSDDRFSWKNKYGSSAQSAFENIKNKILDVVRLAALGDIEAIDQLDFEVALKWKLAYLYQNHEAPCVIAIYKLDKFKWFFPADTKLTHPFVYRELIKRKGDTDLLEYSAQLWKKADELEGKKISEEDEGDFNMSDSNIHEAVPQPLNQILFGPPGTGKTFSTINAALEILDPEFLAVHSGKRDKLKYRFDELVKNQHIRFVTFHQSFSYEDFVEGLSAETENGQIRYDVKSGVFMQLCESAAAKIVRSEKTSLDMSNRRVWKMSLGNTLGEDAYIFDECIAKNKLLLGYGRLIDFSGVHNAEEVHERFVSSGRSDVARDSFAVNVVTTFVTRMAVGDLVVVSDGNTKFRAIGEITGNYECINRDGEDDHYGQSRSVRWLRVYSPSLPYEQLLNKSFSQMTIYQLKEPALDREKLVTLLGDSSESSEVGDNKTPRVLIIDEINRGNISKIFGELITLIEPSKRAGQTEALEVILPYSKKPFSVPSNVYIIGTMNTSDRSLAGLDIALRRRFVFKEMPPKYDDLRKIDVAGINIGELLHVMNQRIEVLLGRDYCLGHAYFMSLTNESSLGDLAVIFQKQIFPLLQEYFFEDWQRIQWVLNDHNKTTDKFIMRKEEGLIRELFGADLPIAETQLPWVINEKAFYSVDAYQGILKVNV